MFLSAVPRGVFVAHIYALKLPLHHLNIKRHETELKWIKSLQSPSYFRL